MKNFVQSGDVVTLVADDDHASGDPIVVGDIAGICATDAIQGEPVEVLIRGVVDLSDYNGTGLSIGAQGAPVVAGSARLGTSLGNGLVLLGYGGGAII